ncbi:MAG TPA: RNA polymerase sigma factor [Gemmataceae bacterium]|jgi:RNA polymerase sigma-70 factor (ECF subfamily)|nr:RNA polymerase sigma factor [Gemmataceae bacterium]
MESLQKRLAAGEPQAFAELYDFCASRVHHYLVVRLRSRDAADDVLQEIFIRLVRQRQRLATVDNLLGYVFAIARNEANRLAGRRHREAKHQLKLSAEHLFLEAASPDVELRETAEAVAAALHQLPDELRELIELKIYGSLTFREIADVLGVPQGTVATRYRTALARLKEWFARQMS